MKRIVSLLLCIIMIIGTFVGCAKEEPTEPETWYMTGTYIRTITGENLIVVDNYGPVVMSGMISEFRALQPGSEIKVKTGAIMETYPAKGEALGVELVEEKPLNIYDEKYDTLIEMGWYPIQLLVTQDPDENYVIHSGDIEQTFKYCHKFNEEKEIVVVLSDEENVTYENYNDINDIVVVFQYDKKNTEQTEVEKPDVEYKENYEAIATLIDEIDNGENIIYSPLSFNIAMGMVANSVSEDLEEKFENYYGMTIEEYNQFAQYYLTQNDEATEHANSIWVKKDFVLQEKFKEIMQKYFDAECENVEFNQEFVEKLNNWCNEKTKGLIPSILDTPPSEDYRCFLVNALYFKENWETEYASNQVRDTEFTQNNGEVITVKGMFSEEHTYLENENATGFMKMYKSGKYAFVGILPKEDGDFNLSDLNIESLLESKKNETVYTMLPKFKFDNTNELTDVIDSIDLGCLKDIGALPNLIQGDATISIGLILQKAIIDVNETGTEAAAVTIVGTKTNSMIGMKEPKKVYLNRAFAFMIYDVENDVVLFAGKVVNPNN